MKIGLVHKVKSSKPYLTITAIAKKIKPWGFAGLSIFDLIKFMVKSFQTAHFGTRAAAISFKFFLALFPTLIFFLSLIPYIPIENFQENLVSSILERIPTELHDIFINTIDDLINHKHSVVLSIGFFLTLFYASNGINTLLITFSQSHQVKIRSNPVKTRLGALLLFLFITILFGGALSALFYGEHLLNSYGQGELGAMLEYIYHLIKWLVVIACMITAVSTLYSYANTRRVKTKFVNAGGILATTTIIIATYGLFVFFTNFSKFNELYGSIGSLIMVLIWMNIVSYILLLGFELNTKVEVEKRSI